MRPIRNGDLVVVVEESADVLVGMIVEVVHTYGDGSGLATVQAVPEEAWPLGRTVRLSQLRALSDKPIERAP